MAKYDFFVLKKYLMKMSHMTKVIYETLAKSIVLNKFSLYYICIRGPEHENRPHSTVYSGSSIDLSVSAQIESHKNPVTRELHGMGFEGLFAKYVSGGQTELGNVKSICKLMRKHVSDC